MTEGFADPPRPTERQVQARLKEVDLRYRRERRLKHPKSDNLRLGQLRRLFRYRGYSEEKARALIDELGDLDAWGRSLGRQVDLLFEELIALRITKFDPVDRTPAAVREYYAAKRADADRERKRRKRAAQPKRQKGLTSRESELLTLISADWTPRAEVVDASVSLPSFSRRGHPLPRQARKLIVRRAFMKFDSLLLIEVDGETYDKHGRRIVAVRKVL